MTAAAAAAAAERLADCTAWPSSAAQRWVHGAVARRPPPHTVVDFHLSAMTAELRDVYGRPPPSDKFEEYNLVGYSRGRTTADAVVTHSGSEHNRRTFSFVCDERAAESEVEEDRERHGPTSSSTTWRTCGSRWKTQGIVPNGEGEPVWLTPHQGFTA